MPEPQTGSSATPTTGAKVLSRRRAADPSGFSQKTVTPGVTRSVQTFAISPRSGFRLEMTRRSATSPISHGSPVDTTSMGPGARSSKAQPSMSARRDRLTFAGWYSGRPWVMVSTGSGPSIRTGTIPIPHSWRRTPGVRPSGNNPPRFRTA